MERSTKGGGNAYWYESLPGEIDVAPPVTGRVTADVCVVGGGFAGLWTAIELKQRHPDTAVALVEAAVCGQGASGRNGGWATSYWRRLPDLQRKYGYDGGLAVATGAARALRDIGAFVAERGIDCDWRQRGGIMAAADPQHVGVWRAAVQACEEAGHPGELRELPADEARRISGSPLVRAAAEHTDTASVNPARLVRGMRAAALDLGVRLYEASPMTALDRGAPATVHTPLGRVEADRVVCTLGAWSSALPELRRAYVSVGSHIVVTAPLTDIPAWGDGMVFGDTQVSNHYAQVTPDGRLVFGRGLGSIGGRNAVTARQLDDPGVQRIVAADLRRLFPQYARTPLTHAWGGAVDRTPDGLPSVGTVGPHGNIHYVIGFSGQGVAQSRYAARVLASVATGAADAYARSGLVGAPSAYFPPDPLRTVGGTVVKDTVQACERLRSLGRRSPLDRAALSRLVGARMPRVIEPRLWGHGRQGGNRR